MSDKRCTHETNGCERMHKEGQVIQTDADVNRWLIDKGSPLVAIGVRLPEAFLKRARRIAKKEGITLSHFVRKTLAREFIARDDIKE